MMKKILGFTLGIAALIYAAYSWVFQTGLYAILIRWQANTFDTYFSSLTFVAIFLGLLIPGILIEKLMGVSGKGLRRKHDMEVSLDELQVRLRSKSRRFLMTTVVLIAGAGVAFYFGQSAPGQDQEAINIDLNNIDDANYWFKKVSLNGELQSEFTYSITSKSNKRVNSSETRYTPIAAKGGGQKTIHYVLIKTSNHNMRVNPKLAMTGFVMPSVLPVLVRDAFEAGGLLMADKVHVIGKSVVSLQMALYIAAGTLALIALILFFSWMFMPIAKRRQIKEWHELNQPNQ